MVLLESRQLKQDDIKVDFSLPDTDGTIKNYEACAGLKGAVVLFTCNHCPYAKAIWSRMISLAQRFMPKGIGFVAINPNSHPDYPEDSPEKMASLAKELCLPFSYLYDATQSVAKAYKAVCTPDIYVFDGKKNLFYHGRLDDSWQDVSKASSFDLADALEALLKRSALKQDPIPSMGCSIKWFD